jgi:hypothetical protein
MEKMLKFLARQCQTRILPHLSGPNEIDALNCFSRCAVLNCFSSSKPYAHEKAVYSSLSLSLSLLCSVAMLAQQNPNCTDFELCFQKRLGAAGDTIIDVLLINPPDSIVGANFEVRMSAEAYGGQVFDVHSAFAALNYTPMFNNGAQEDWITFFQSHNGVPILLSEDTVKLYSFTILASPGDCINLRFIDNAAALVSAGGTSFPFNFCNPTAKCTEVLCFPAVPIGGVIETVPPLNCVDTVVNNYGLRDIIVRVYQNSDTAVFCAQRTNSYGRYECSLAPGHDYTFIPTPDDAVLVDTCGVTEIDLAIISRHILGINYMDEPYQIIAADANQSGTITALDLTALAALLQGVKSLPKNWEIVEVNSYYALPDPIPASMQPVVTVPAYDTSKTIYNLPPGAPSSNASFVGVKIGDVNKTCQACYASGGNFGLLEERQAISAAAPQIFSVHVPTALSVGSSAYLPVYAESFAERAVLGLQLWLSPEHFEILGMSPGALPEMETAAMSKNADGRLGLTWFSLSPEGVTLEGSEPLFYLVVKLLAIPADWQAAIALQDRAGRNIMIDNAGEARPLALEVILPQTAAAEGDLAVFPNPFRESLQIAVEAPSSGPAEIALLDASGQAVARRSLRLESGPNLISLEGLGSLPPGFYALRLVAQGGERWHGKAIKF